LKRTSTLATTEKPDFWDIYHLPIVRMKCQSVVLFCPCDNLLNKSRQRNCELDLLTGHQIAWSSPIQSPRPRKPPYPPLAKSLNMPLGALEGMGVVCLRGKAPPIIQHHPPCGARHSGCDPARASARADRLKRQSTFTFTTNPSTALINLPATSAVVPQKTPDNDSSAINLPRSDYCICRYILVLAKSASDPKDPSARTSFTLLHFLQTRVSRLRLPSS